MTTIKNWVLARVAERTSWDGAFLIGGGIAMILVPLDLVAYGMIGYGAWTLWKKESK